MFVPLSCLSNMLKKNFTDITGKMGSKDYATLIIVMATVTMSIIFLLSFSPSEGTSWNDNTAYSQTTQKNDANFTENKVTIRLSSVEFAPLTNGINNQLKVLVDYQTNDPMLVNTPMSGTMKVFLLDGIPLKTSNIQKGYVLGQAGPIQFATSLEDKTIQDIKADIYLTDTLGNQISNTLRTNASLVNQS
jgi:hypothetical protein